MKTLTTALFTGITLVLASSAFAGRDQAQIMQQERAIKALQAEKLALAKQAQQGLAGAPGVPGKAEPSRQPIRVRRDPTAHP